MDPDCIIIWISVFVCLQMCSSYTKTPGQEFYLESGNAKNPFNILNSWLCGSRLSRLQTVQVWHYLAVLHMWRNPHCIYFSKTPPPYNKCCTIQSNLLWTLHSESSNHSTIWSILWSTLFENQGVPLWFTHDLAAIIMKSLNLLPLKAISSSDM